MKQDNKLILAIVLLAACLIQFASDIFIPSLPAIAVNLKTHVNLVQWSMAVYMFGVAFSQLLYGPISEGVGRKTPFVIGLAIMLIGSVISWLAPTIDILLLGRLIQGWGAGGTALWRSIFRDTYSGRELAKYSSYLTIFVVFVIPVAPLLGGYLQHHFGWRASFLFVSAYTAIAFLGVLFFFKETNEHHHKERLKLSYIKRTYLKMLCDPTFAGTTLSVFLTYGAFFAWFTAGPVLLIHPARMSPIVFGWYTFLGAAVAYVLAGWLNGKLVGRFGMPTMMRAGWGIMTLAGLLMLAGHFAFGLNVWVLAAPPVLFYFGATFIWPNAFATAFTPFGKIAGYAGALYGGMQIAGGAVLAGLVAYLPDTNQIPIALIFIASPLLACGVYEFGMAAAKRREDNI